MQMVHASLIHTARWVGFDAGGDALLHAVQRSLGRYESGNLAVEMRCGAIGSVSGARDPEGRRLCPHCLADFGL